MALSLCVVGALGAVAAPPVISGTGKFRYQYDPTKLVLPSSVQLLNGHGLTRDKVYTLVVLKGCIRVQREGSRGDYACR